MHNTSYQLTQVRDLRGLDSPNPGHHAIWLKTAMLSRLLNPGILLALLVEIVACMSGGNVHHGVSTDVEPSIDILKGNFAQASYVFEIEVNDVRQAATFRSDSGEAGYVQYSVTGTVLDVLKSIEEWEPLSREVVYRFTQEHDPAAGSLISKGGRYVVFLMLADDPSGLWVIGNGAQFELSPELSKVVRRIAGRE